MARTARAVDPNARDYRGESRLGGPPVFAAREVPKPDPCVLHGNVWCTCKKALEQFEEARGKHFEQLVKAILAEPKHGPCDVPGCFICSKAPGSSP